MEDRISQQIDLLFMEFTASLQQIITLFRKETLQYLINQKSGDDNLHNDQMSRGPHSNSFYFCGSVDTHRLFMI